MNDDQPSDQPQAAAHEQIGRAEQEGSEPAHILQGGIPYVRNWARAARAVAALEEELHACGLDGALPYLRADVNVFGVGVIELGRITPETAYAITTLLAQARTARDDTRKGSAA